LIVFLLFFLGGFSPVLADFAPGKIIVKFKPGIVEIPRGMRAAGITVAKVKAASVSALNTKHGVFKIKQLYKDALENRPDWTQLENHYVIYFPKDKKVSKVAEDFKKDPSVVSATSSSILRAFAVTPNDPRYSSQYGLTNIRAPQAWDRTTGSSSIVVAVLDTGINDAHEDFAGRIDSRGKDYVNDDNDPADDYGHGTAVAGVIGAATNNGVGVAGVDWQAKILPIKVLDSLGNGEMDHILDGIAYANSLGVEVMNMSFGQYFTDSGLEQRCLEAYQNGVVLVAAAGNGNVDTRSYPAAYSSVMAIAAVDASDVRSYWGQIDPVTGKPQASNYGDWVDVSAPGSGIWSTHRNGGYASNNGTSFSAPFVAGVAALIKAATPGMTNQQIMERIIDTADNIDALQQAEYQGKLGSGRMNAADAVAGVTADISSPTDGEYVKGTVSVNGQASGWNFSSYEVWALRNGTPEVNINSSNTAVNAGLLGSWDTTGKNGAYTIELKVYATGAASDEAEVSVFVDNTPPEAAITSPATGATLSGKTTITGAAKDQYFERYVLEYGAGTSPTSYQSLTQSYSPVDGGVLATWETSGLSGDYTLRLTAYDMVGTSTSTSLPVYIQSTSVADKGVEAQAGLPPTFALPNPFDRSQSQDAKVIFSYSLSGNFNTKIYLFDMGGNLIWQKSYVAGENGGKAGENNPTWSGQDLFGGRVPNGIYFYQVVAGGRVIARGKMVVLN
jgi:subtilisin family serine protease